MPDRLGPFIPDPVLFAKKEGMRRRMRELGIHAVPKPEVLERIVAEHEAAAGMVGHDEACERTQRPYADGELLCFHCRADAERCRSWYRGCCAKCPGSTEHVDPGAPCFCTERRHVLDVVDANARRADLTHP